MFANLTGKAALITGSTQGIGLATIKRLAQAGANVCLNGFGEPNKIEETRASIEKEYGVKCVYINSDVRTADGCYELVEQFEKQLGGVDVLVNNVGTQFVGDADVVADDKFRDIIDINLNSCFYISKKVIPYMKKQDWGRIVNISSIHGLIGSVSKAPYCMSKHGIIGYTKATGLELATTGISVNAICPGFVFTDIIKSQIEAIQHKEGITFEQAKYELLKPKQPSLKGIPPEHIADTVLFLCSEAAGSMKGASVSVDGGWTAQ